MMKIANGKVLLLLATLSIATAGCGKKEVATPFTDSEGLLRYVPADTPYFLGTLEPAPDEFYDKVGPALEGMLSGYADAVAAFEEALAEAADAEPVEDAEDIETLLAILRGVKPLMSRDGYESLGFSRDTLAIFYGHGLLPVMRLTVTDSGTLDSWLARIEAEAGAELAVGSIQGKSYRYFDHEGMRAVIGTFDQQLVLTLMPSDFDDEQLARLLGLELPGSNLADTGILQGIADEYGYLAAFIGFMNFELLADTFIAAPSGLNAGLLEIADYDAGTLDDVCKVELRGLAATMPRMVMGYEAITAERIDTSTVFELREDLARGLSAVPAAVPGLGQAFDGLFSFGMSMDLKAAREFYAARVDALENDPFECDLLADLQASAVAGREALNQPVPPIVYDFNGFLALVNDVEGFSPAQQAPPESIDGSLLVSMDNATGLLALGRMFSPELNELEIEPDGTPHLLDLPVVAAAGIEQPWVAMTDDALALSLSADGDKQLPALLAAESSNPPPLMSMNVDAERYYDFVADAMVASTDNAEMDEFQATMAKVMVEIGSLYDRVMVDVLLTERGIEISMDTTLAD